MAVGVVRGYRPAVSWKDTSGRSAMSHGRRISTETLAFLLCLPLVAWLAEPGRAQAYLSFDEWVVGCDNLRRCTALGLGPEDGHSGGFIRITREGDPNAPAQVEIVVFAEGIDDAAGIRLIPEVDGRPVLDDAMTPVAGDFDQLRATMPDTAVEPFLAAIGAAEHLSLSLVHSDGRRAEPIAISPIGGAAALAEMDRQQRRSGTVTALVHKGELPVGAVPAASEKPRHAQPRTVSNGRPPQRPAELQDVLCEDVLDEDAPDRGMIVDEVGWLGSNLAFWALRCFSGAYNFASSIWIGPQKGPIRPAPFNVPATLASEIDTEALVNVYFDQASLTLDFFAKGRGLGDCGSAGTWMWDGNQFQLLRFSKMNTCRFIFLPDWPVLWRAEVADNGE